MFLWTHRDWIIQWLQRLFGKRADSETAETRDELDDLLEQEPARAFASFSNPIGKESDLRRIVVITFQAFDAWTREQGTPRGKDETPAEFIRRVAPSVPQLSNPATQVVEAYNRIVYGRGQATQSDLTAAQQVWAMMQSST